MVLTQKQTHWSMEQNREPRNGPTNVWPTNLWQSRKEYPMEKRQSCQQMVLGKLDSNMQKNELGPLPYTISKNKLKMDERPKRKIGNHKNPRGLNRQQPLWPWPQQLLTRHVSREKGNKSKDLIKIKSFWTAKQTINKTKRPGKVICKWHIR